MEDWFVYLLKCADDTLYTGITKNMLARLKKHDAGIGAKYTRGRRPLSLKAISSKTYSESAARKLEAKIKKMKKSDKIDFFKLI